LLALLAIAAAPAIAGPPWMSIELPANPFDRTTRGAYAVVHTYHHDVEVPYIVVGTAEGLVNGQRRSVRLQAEPTGRTGSFAIRKNWTDDGVWVLKIGVEDVEIGMAIGVGSDGQVSFVRVPTSRNGAPRQVARAEVETMLRALAEGRQPPMLAAAGGGYGHAHGGAIAVQLGGLGAIGGALVIGLLVRRRRKDRN
jgi:hypothetical protein